MTSNTPNTARVALVTGAAKGIGATIARRLAQDGRLVVIGDIDEATAQGTVDELSRDGFAAAAVRLDVADAASVASAFSYIEGRWGRCDIVVNNAGIAKAFPFVDFPLENWQAHLNVNLTGAFLCSQHGARLMMREGWGRIVNIASVAGLRAVGVGRTGYGTSKAAIIGLTRQMAVELAAHGITANAIAPGPVDTPMTRVFHSPQFRQMYTSAIPMKRYGTQEEVADAVAYVSSEGAAYVTGTVIPVDGGFMASGAHRWE
ncbi:MAG: SDR family oxidoreductase [Betaproteobacteria bacterium]|nr:SDR family oxidoreductase [Betaproteobacteria bacterium]